MSKPLSEYYKAKYTKKDGTKTYCYHGSCKACYSKTETDRATKRYQADPEKGRAKSRDSYFNNHEVSKARKAVYYKANKEKFVVYRRENAANNRDRERARAKEWRRNNLASDCAKVSRRRALKINATPTWADKCKIKAIYIESADKTVSTGVKHNVDHIVPLNSDKVCGLHCEDNLQIILATDNVKKSNKFVDDIC